jgi:hypothetical protein
MHLNLNVPTILEHFPNSHRPFFTFFQLLGTTLMLFGELSSLISLLSSVFPSTCLTYKKHSFFSVQITIKPSEIFNFFYTDKLYIIKLGFICPVYTQYI